MKFSITRDKLLATIQRVNGVVERRGSNQILSYLLLQVTSHQLRLTGTDLEVEMCANVTLDEPGVTGDVTVPARKLFDICKALPDSVTLDIALDNNKVIIKAGRSRFSLATLPVIGFPKFIMDNQQVEFDLPQALLKTIIDRTLFSVASQDVRYYLNGLFLQIKDNQIIAVGTDGHRLAIFSHALGKDIADCQVIIPKKAILELQRLLEQEGDITLAIANKLFCAKSKHFTMVSKIIEGTFPDYNAVIPKNTSSSLKCSKDQLKNTLSRMSILTNEKYKGVSFYLSKEKVVLSSRNPEAEEAEEELAAKFTGEQLNIGFNVSYLIDILNHIPPGNVTLSFTDTTSSTLVEPEKDEYACKYVVMPMRI